MRARLLAGLFISLLAGSSWAAEEHSAASYPVGDAEAGAGKAAVCGACHGLDGNSTDPQYPKLAGQHAAYTSRHLEHYKSGVRENAIMAGFASVLSSEDMHDIGAYFAAQTVQTGVADETIVSKAQALYRGGDTARGIPACMACHGPGGGGNPLVPYPALSGQHANYSADMLRRYRDGAVYGDDANAAVMADVAKALTDAEIDALASYMEGLHSR